MDRWLGVEIRHLAALAAIEEERSFRGAADRLGYVQSAVSQQISRLEGLVGTRLVERARGHTRVELTTEGQLLLQHAQRMLAQLQAAQTDLQRLSDGISGRLRIGAFQSVATRIMPTLLTRIASERPDIEVMTTETPSDMELFAAVEAGELDAGFAELPLEEGPFEYRQLLTEACVLLVPRDSPLARPGRRVTLAEIVAQPLIAHPAWRMAKLIDHHLRAAGHEPLYRFQSDTNTAIQALVSSGLAAAILPQLAVDEDDPDTVQVDVAELLPRRTLVLFWHRDRVGQPALEAFARTAETACAQVAWRDGGGRPAIAA